MPSVAGKMAMRLWCVCLILHALFVLAATAGDAPNIAFLHSRPPHRMDHLSMDLLKQTSSLLMTSDNDGDDDDENPCDSPDSVVGDYTTCGEGFCRCRGNVADCSNHHGHLTYVPELPLGITTLLFNYNNLTAILRDDFFTNVTGITTLDLEGNGITSVSPGAFLSLRNLKKLLLNGNNFTYAALAPVFSIQTLKILDLSANRLGTPHRKLFHQHPMPQLEVLCLNQNNMASLNMATFAPLSRLNHLELYYNKLSRKTLKADFLPQLTKQLRLDINSFYQFFETCKNNTSVFPNLKELYFRYNRIQWLDDVRICLPSLEILHLGFNFIGTVYTDMFGPKIFPSLRKVYLRLMISELRTIQKNAFRNPALEAIELQNNRIDFAADSVDPDSFANCPNLKLIELYGNNLSKVSTEKFDRLFGQIKSLKALGIEATGLGQINADMFTNLKNLTALWLHSNEFTEIPDGVFDGLRLTRLSLHDNRISAVKETTFSVSTRKRLSYLDLSGNPYPCNCDLKWFRNWLLTDPWLFDKSWDSYICDNMPNTTVQSFFLTEQACLFSQDVSIFICVVVLMLICTLSLSTLLFRYRWHIRLMLYEAFRGRTDRWRRLRENIFEFDVFVSYAKSDLPWVRTNLMSELENRFGLQLCIHERDFIAGQNIVDNIVDCVKTSKKILMVFSQGFAKSHWCQFELNLCLNHVLEHDDALLVVVLEDIPSRDLTPAMMAVMKTMTYIRWEDEFEARTSFWGRLHLALSEILPGI